MSKLEVDQKMLRDLAEVLNDAGLTEIEIADGDHVIRIAKEPAPVIASAPAIAAAPTAAPVAAAAAAASPADAAAPVTDMTANHPGAVTSPMVGTAYRSPEPTAPVFVDIGSVVSKGQTLLIIEAMKTFNEIPAPHDGTVKAIMFDNQSPVEFGDVLMIIE